MSERTASARVLVATQDAREGSEIAEALGGDFEGLRLSSDPHRIVSDFEAFEPDVVVLAQGRLELARSYCLALSKAGPLVADRPHKTVVLCAKDEVRAAFEMCKQGTFDDYVLYWPHTFDAPRLKMSILNGFRALVAARREGPTAHELQAHARLLDGLERGLDLSTSEARTRLQKLRVALADAESGIVADVDALSRHLDENRLEQAQAADHKVLAGRIAELKVGQVARMRSVGEEVMGSLDALATDLTERVAPLLTETRALRERIRSVRSLVMVVDDDALMRTLIARVLDPAVYEAVYVEDAAEAMGKLRRLRPDVILMDVRMPRLDGVRLTVRLKGIPCLARIPVVMMTGDGRRQTLIESLDAGAAHFIVKPFTRATLLTKLQDAIAGAHTSAPTAGP